jgi:adenylate cyclase
VLNVERSTVARGVTIDAAWRAISDTNTLNRAAGLGTVTFEPYAGRSAARQTGRTRLAGMQVRYEELPFEWELYRRVVSRRDMLEGPLRALQTTFEIAEEDEGVRITVRLAIELRWPPLRPILKVQAGSSAERLVQTIVALAQPRVEPEAPPLPSGNGAFARAAATLLADPEARHAGRLLTYVQTADDLELARIRPYPLADAWGLDRSELLVTCLASVLAGVLDLRWEVVCPGCVNPVARFPTLSDLGAEGRCHVCDLAFVLDFERSVEATFNPNPSVREVSLGPWCSGGPARYPHAHTQMLLPAGARTRLAVPTTVGTYRLFVRGDASQEIEVDPGAPVETSVKALLAPGEAPDARPALRVAPGGAIYVENTDPANDAHARIESVPARLDAASARDVTALDAFRTRFSSETLRPGVALHVERVALLFSDLSASTELYARLGDAAAFRLVSDHFDVMRAAIVRHGGSVVKTIGDAVMAAFRDEDAAVAAALHALAAMEDFRARSETRAATHVKLGVHAGPCYAIFANGTNDYFGQTVNIAARMQSLAAPAELALAAPLAERARPPEGWRLDVTAPEEARLRGVGAPVLVRRLRLTRAG